MNLRSIGVLMLISVFLLALSSGCAKYATKGKMIGTIEKQATIGMAEEEFTKKVPHAKLVEEDNNKKVYLVAASDPCFVCSSWGAFARSYELYATKFTFKNGNLVSAERIMSGK